MVRAPALHAIDEAQFVLDWIGTLRSAADDRVRGIGILVRPHPNKPQEWRSFDLSRFENVSVWPALGSHPVGEERRAEFFDTLAHSAAVVGINTTAMIEAAVVGRGVMTVLEPEFAQETTLHFHYLLAENGGFLNVAGSLAEHVEQVARVLAEDHADAERRRRFVEAFVRPHGLDRPATPILADEIEELAALPVEAPARHLLLRAVLTVEAALSSAAILAAPVSDRWRRSSRRRLELSRGLRATVRHALPVRR